MSLSRTLTFVTLTVAATATLVGMFLVHRYVQVVHFDDVHRVITQTQTPPGISPVTKSELQFEKKMHESETRLAKAMSQVTVEDGFTIANVSDVPLTTVVFRCNVDGAEQVFEWDQTDMVVSTGARIPPHTIYAPEILVYRLETQKQFEALETNDVAILHVEEMLYVLDHHKVTACSVFQIGTDWK